MATTSRNEPGWSADPAAVTLQVVVVFDHDTITGRIARAGHPPSDFMGWLGLMATIERMNAPPGQPDSGPGGSERGDP